MTSVDYPLFLEIPSPSATPQTPLWNVISAPETSAPHASALLDREKHHTHAEALLRPSNDGIIAALPQDADWDTFTGGVAKLQAAKASEEQQVIDARINQITEKADELRQRIADYKQYVDKEKKLHALRSQELDVERKQLEKQKPRVLDPLQSAIRKAGHRLEKVRTRTVDARVVLCREAASLSGLQKRKGSGGKSEYWLGGVRIPDLRELHSVSSPGKSDLDGLVQPYHLVSTACDNVCRLLVNCCHHLSVRLPYEILLPHDDFPHAMIVPEKSSYRLKDPSYPGMASSQTASPSASRLVDHKGEPLPRPRPLALDRPIKQLFKDDGQAFKMYLEGVMLLAWDVAWLCKTQGVDSVDSFEDSCAVGRNLYQLFIAQGQQRPPLERNVSAATTRTDRSKQSTPVPTIGLGYYSHGSAHHSLSGHEGTTLLQGWPLDPPRRLSDKLRAYLRNQMKEAEWDFISGAEWDDQMEEDMAVLVGGAKKAADRHGPAMSVMSLKPSDGADDDDARPGLGKPRGSSGWMKVRGRGGDG